MTGLSQRRKQLKDELSALGEEAMLIEEFDGLVAGLLICPDLISPRDWLPIVFGQDGEDEKLPFDDADHANRVLALVMDHYNDVALTLMQHPERYRPLYPVDQRNGDVVWEIWIEGFARAASLRPEAWQEPIEADSETADAMLGMLTLGEIVMGEGERDMSEALVDKLTGAAPELIPDWVVTLYQWRIAKTKPGSKTKPASKPASIIEHAPRPVAVPQRKVGRNEPCPCGSGKKYKKCCGMN
jgi:uncharacterized protein